MPEFQHIKKGTAFLWSFRACSYDGFATQGNGGAPILKPLAAKPSLLCQNKESD